MGNGFDGRRRDDTGRWLPRGGLRHSTEYGYLGWSWDMFCRTADEMSVSLALIMLDPLGMDPTEK